VAQAEGIETSHATAVSRTWMEFHFGDGIVCAMRDKKPTEPFRDPVGANSVPT